MGRIEKWGEGLLERGAYYKNRLPDRELIREEVLAHRGGAGGGGGLNRALTVLHFPRRKKSKPRRLHVLFLLLRRVVLYSFNARLHNTV